MPSRSNSITYYVTNLLISLKCLSEPNRWIPRSFDGSYISPHHQLQSNPLGDGLILHHKSKEWWQARKCLSLIMLPSDMNLNGDQSVQVCANGQRKCLQVNFLRDSHPPLDLIESISFLVLEGALEHSGLTTESQSTLKGCCLRLPVLGPTSRADIEQDECCQSTGQSFQKHIASFTYDCPVQVKYTEISLGPEEEPISTSCGPSKAHEIKGPWSIEIKCGRFHPRTLQQSCLLLACSRRGTDKVAKLSPNTAAAFPAARTSPNGPPIL